MCGVSTRLGQPAKIAARSALKRLLVEDVERRAAEPAGLQGLRDRRLVDDAAAGGVDEDRVGLRPRQRLGADQVARLRRQRHMQRNHVRRRDEIVEGDGLDAAPGLVPGRTVGGHIGVVGHDAHPERRGALRRLPGDGAEADEAEALARDLAAHRAGRAASPPRSPRPWSRRRRAAAASPWRSRIRRPTRRWRRSPGIRRCRGPCRPRGRCCRGRRRAGRPTFSFGAAASSGARTCVRLRTMIARASARSFESSSGLSASSGS